MTRTSLLNNISINGKFIIFEYNNLESGFINKLIFIRKNYEWFWIHTLIVNYGRYQQIKIFSYLSIGKLMMSSFFENLPFIAGFLNLGFYIKIMI